MEENKSGKKSALAGYSIEEYAVAVLLAVMCISILLATFSRYTSLFIMQLTWCEELSRFCMIYLCFIGSAVAISRGSHFVMTAVIGSTHGAVHRILTIIDYVVTFVFLVIVAYLGVKQVMTVFSSGMRSTVMGLPMWIVYAALPIGGIDMVVRTLIIMIKAFKNKDEGSVTVE